MNSIGRYQLVEKLGQGGMGVVYRAFDTLLQRVVAVKVISGAIESGGEQRERFFREARAAGQLSHRNIITIHDLGEHDGQPYLAMEYLEGEDLQRRLARPERMSLARKVEIAIEVCEGLEYAHARGVIHRDVKPANIFITSSGTAKILDFGLARLVTSELTNSNMMMGTINYMAPEQVRGERADQRSDIFSVGVVLYELLGGRKAFDGDSFATTLYRILQEEPESLLHIEPALPPDLVAIVERALAKPRDERYQQMSDMLRDLSVHRQQMSVHDTPAGRPAPGVTPRPSEPPRLPSSRDSDAPTVAYGTTPFPALPSEPPHGSAGAGTPAPSKIPSGPARAIAADAGTSRRRLWIGLAAGLLAIAALATWAVRRPEPSAEPSAPVAAQAPAIDQAALASDVAQARQALQAGDFTEAARHAEAVLAVAPDHAEARRISDEAASALDRVARGLEEARDAMAAGRFDAASRAAGGVLGIAPANQEARQLMQEAAARSRGRGADEARARMNEAKRAARAASAQTLASHAYEAALGAERAAQRLIEAGNPADAMARFYEASGLYRSAEISAKSEAAARAERAEAERVAKAEKAAQEAKAAEEAKAEQERKERERAAAASAQPPTPPPVSATRGANPPATGAAAPKPPPSAPAPPPEPSAETLITDLLAQYTAALESRSLTAMKRIWPALGGVRESALRDEFQQASQISVQIAAPRIDVADSSATVHFIRHYELTTKDGQRLRSQSATTMNCRRTPGGWVIEQVRYEPIR